ncbi:MAG: ATP-binding protein [Bacteroidales bacterium]|nr:ATP-binding protein [Candidatus Colicola faecequi]
MTNRTRTRTKKTATDTMEAPKKRTRKKTSGFSAENATILSAMEYITRNLSRSVCDDSAEGLIDQSDSEACQYLQQRLNLGKRQVQLLSACMFAYACNNSNGFSLDEIAKMMDMSAIFSLGLEVELEELEDNGLLGKTGPFDSAWCISKEARKAFINNKSFGLESLRCEGNLEFLQEVNRNVKAGMRHDSDGSICKAVGRLFRINTHLPVVRNLDKLNLNNLDRWVMLLMLSTLGGAEDDFVNGRDLEQALRPNDVRRVVRQIQQGTYVLVKKGYLEPYAEEGFAKADSWVLSRKALTEMLEDEDDVQVVLRDDTQTSGLLTSYKELKPRKLFFSEAMQQQVDRLGELLSEERFCEVRDMLSQKGLPKGFCCLFYGTPGTGKTELVQQLAIRTGRDLMQVDVSQLRDKFVGESEKRVKAVFDNYRRAVMTCKTAPILFFNEADAIFGNRMENTPRSVDKMENALQNIILQEMEKLEGIMICTTNLTSTLDKAFERRFLYKIEFSRPNAEARKHIWQDMVSGLTDEQAGELAERFDFSGGQIQNISRKQIIQQVFSGTTALNYEQLLMDCNAEKLSRNNGRKIGF